MMLFYIKRARESHLTTTTHIIIINSDINDPLFRRRVYARSRVRACMVVRVCTIVIIIIITIIIYRVCRRKRNVLGGGGKSWDLETPLPCVYIISMTRTRTLLFIISRARPTDGYDGGDNDGTTTTTTTTTTTIGLKSIFFLNFFFRRTARPAPRDIRVTRRARVTYIIIYILYARVCVCLW